MCATGSFTLNGACVSANSNGICEGTSLIADNNKRECDGEPCFTSGIPYIYHLLTACGAKCTKCTIPNFGVASTVNQKQCIDCLPGFFLSNGSCVESCPTGTTLSSQDNLTCIGAYQITAFFIISVNFISSLQLPMQHMLRIIYILPYMQ